MSLDGYLEEATWRLALPATDFIQNQPQPGQAANQRTEVRFIYDDDNLYVGFTAFDTNPELMTIQGLQEDFGQSDTDQVTVTIDSLHDRRSGFQFSANPVGARRDAQIFNDGQGNFDWDGVWDVRTSRNSEGWIAEFMIPFKTLRFSTDQSQEWGVNLSRRVIRLNELDHWSPIPTRYNAFRVSLAGTLRGLEGIRQGRNLKVKPFVTGGFTQVQGTPVSKDKDGGVDLKYSLTPQLTLDATYRTDFAQVEVDQQQVNLTRFNLFFPEKRDFFLENSGTFNFGPGGNLVPFFSRRIGLSSAGTRIPIVGGGRVSGKAGRYDVGFIAMKTERLDSTPSNNYVVGRLKRNLLRNSWIGTLVTNRDSTLAGDYNRVYGTDAHFQFFNKLEFDSYLLKSDTPVRSGRNQARRFQSGWRDEELTVSAEYNSIQPNFNPEVGFVRRRDMEQYSGDLSWRPQLRSNPTIRSINFGSSLDYFGGSGSGKVETRVQNGNLGITFDNSASATLTIEQTFDRLANDLRIPSGNPRVTIPAGDYRYLGYSAHFTGGQGWKVGGSATINWGEFYSGRRKALSGTLNLKPDYHLQVNLTYDRNQVTLANGSFTTNIVGAKFLYGFTPRAFFNAYIQYNADTHLVSSNIRFNWTHHPLSDLYIVYNDTRNTLTGQLRERAFIVKLTNLFNF